VSILCHADLIPANPEYLVMEHEWLHPSLCHWYCRLRKPAREGPVREGPVREDPVREGPVREDPVREGPVREGPVRRSAATHYQRLNSQPGRWIGISRSDIGKGRVHPLLCCLDSCAVHLVKKGGPGCILDAAFDVVIVVIQHRKGACPSFAMLF